MHLALTNALRDLPYTRERSGVMRVVCRAARDICAADGAAFVVRDEHRCFYAEEDAIAPLWKGQRFPASTCVSGWSMINDEPAVIEDISVDPRIPLSAYTRTFVRSLAMVPVREGAPVGAIGVYWSKRHKPTDDQLKALSLLARHTAAALSAARS